MMFGLRNMDIEAIQNCFRNYPSINRVILYGSRAKGNYKPGSDIDLSIEDKEMSFDELTNLETELDDLLLPYKVDLSLKKNIKNPDLLEHIMVYGKVFYEDVN